ncbi:MAG TPA: CDP-alcohol phosphatidyltransferase family protein [Actinomycetales bacterium]|nr:CDP-alcohol phosphatidyltransferase family protein [Actinomycetales bacterium]
MNPAAMDPADSNPADSDPADADELTRRLLGRRDDRLGTQVLVVVDPEHPGAAALRVPGGGTLAGRVARLAVREAGESCGVVREASVTASVDAVASALRERDDVPAVVVDGATVATGTSLGDVVADPRAEASLLGSSDGQVVAVRVPSRHRAGVADSLEALLGREPRTRVLDLLVVACEAADLALSDRSDGVLPVSRAESRADLDAALAAERDLDEVRVRLRRAQRGDDGFLSTFGVRPLSRRLTPVVVRWGLAPATVTAAALVLGLLSAVAYGLAATGSATAWRVVGSVLLLVSLVVDCVDGEVARSTRTSSARGGWLDVAADRVKEYAVYAGLAVGTGNERVAWWLALAAMALLVTRHFVDFGFAASRPVMQSAATRQRVATERITQRGRGVTSQGRVAAWSDRTSDRPALKWAKRAVIMPVGERTLLLVVLAPLAGVRLTLTVLLVLGVVAAAWTTAGRVGRALDAAVPGDGDDQGTRTARLRAQLDAAPAPAAGGLLISRAGWLLPAAARALEQGVVAALVAWLAPEALPWAFAWLAVVAFGLYDLVYRQRLAGTAGVQGLLNGVPFGWPLRLLLVLVVLLAAGAHAGAVLGAAGGLLAVLLLVSSGRFWAAPVLSTP